MRFVFAGIDQAAKVEVRSPRNASEIVPGADLQLRCVCGGTPEPLVHWFHNGDR